MSYYRDIVRIIDEYRDKCKNMGLILDKYVPEGVAGNNEAKGKWLRSILASDHTDTELVQNIYSRWIAMVESMGALRFSAATDWRMVVGLGGETVLETDLTLHHLYGIPYIPGSALKGLTRAYAVTEEKDFYIPENKPVDERVPSTDTDNDHPDIKRIFGTQKDSGTVIFLDAMPQKGKAQLILDIMNPHYPDYYRTQQSSQPSAPTNDQKPNPVAFLTVTDTTFVFAVAPRNPKIEQHKTDTEQVSRLLQQALQKYGVGGKTSAGYGYFKDIKDGQGASSVDQVSQSVSTVKPAQPSAPAERIRPAIPNFRAGQDITGTVVAPTDELRRRTPAEAKAFLRYSSFALKDVLMVVDAEEVQNWKPGETRICLFVKEEVRDGCTLLVCQPRPSKKKR